MDSTHNRSTHKTITAGLILAGLAFSSVASADAPKPLSDSPPTETLAFGASVEKVALLLGSPQFASEIPCLGRRMVAFKDGTKVTFVNNRAVSASPGGLAEGSPATGYTLFRDDRRVMLDPTLLGGVAVPPAFELAETYDESFRYVPPTPFLPAPHVYPPYLPHSSLHLLKMRCANCSSGH